MRNHGMYAGKFSCLADIQVLDTSTRMRAVQQLTGEHARQLNIRTVAGLTRDNIMSAGGDCPLTCYVRFTHF